MKIWTNRPIWPQGFQEPPPADPKPEGLAWDQFLGRAPVRPFSTKIHPFNWRGFQDYGCGALGDMACHLMDAAYWGLELGAPTSVELKQIDSPSKIAFPKSAVVEYQFPPELLQGKGETGSNIDTFERGNVPNERTFVSRIGSFHLRPHAPVSPILWHELDEKEK